MVWSHVSRAGLGGEFQPRLAGTYAGSVGRTGLEMSRQEATCGGAAETTWASWDNNDGVKKSMAFAVEEAGQSRQCINS